jgi:hypothetical protein
LHSSEKGIATHGKKQSLFESSKISDFHHHPIAPSDNTKINKLGLKRRRRSNKSSIANRGKYAQI